MTDYAGPILGAVGAVVGFYVGGPTGAQWGWAIGMTVGGAYATSQQVIPGPKIGDIQKQTAQEGGFRPIVYGRSLPLFGNVIADSDPVIVPGKVSSGKGGPKQQAGESAFRTYAVGFCEGETTLLQAWRNGILVYDAEDPSMAAENAKFLSYATWYTGSFEQMPDPDIEAIYGAGNAPFFRGTSYLALASEDVTDQRGAWSQWQVRVFRGSAKSYTTPPYPVMVMDSLSGAAESQDARVLNYPLEELDFDVAARPGVLRSLVAIYAGEVEEIDFGVAARAGVLRALVATYITPSEELNATVQARNGTLRTVVIQYLNYSPEEINASVEPRNGTLGPI